MAASARYIEPLDVNAPEKPRNGVLTIDGVDWFGPLPPNSGDLRATYDAWIASGGTVEEYIAPQPQSPRSVAMWRARTIMKVTPWNAGTLFQAVQAAIAGLEDLLQRAIADEALERGDIFDRDGVFVPMLAAIVGISDEQLDELMSQAAALPA
jgi:hypothetical protein